MQTDLFQLSVESEKSGQNQGQDNAFYFELSRLLLLSNVAACPNFWRDHTIVGSNYIEILQQQPYRSEGKFPQ